MQYVAVSYGSKWGAPNMTSYSCLHAHIEAMLCLFSAVFRIRIDAIADGMAAVQQLKASMLKSVLEPAVLILIAGVQTC